MEGQKKDGDYDAHVEDVKARQEFGNKLLRQKRKFNGLKNA